MDIREKRALTAAGVGTVAAGLALLIEKVRARVVRPLSLHFEQPLGTPVDEVDTGTEFYFVGYYKSDTTPLRNETIYVYRVEADGRPTDEYVRGTTDEAGKYEISHTAPSVTRSTNFYYRAFDTAQRP